jgi:hypothetical protein
VQTRKHLDSASTLPILAMWSWTSHFISLNRWGFFIYKIYQTRLPYFLHSEVVRTKWCNRCENPSVSNIVLHQEQRVMIVDLWGQESCRGSTQSLKFNPGPWAGRADLACVCVCVCVCVVYTGWLMSFHSISSSNPLMAWASETRSTWNNPFVCVRLVLALFF